MQYKSMEALSAAIQPLLDLILYGFSLLLQFIAAVLAFLLDIVRSLMVSA